MTKLYIMDVTPLCEDKLFERSLSIVSDRRREKALAFRKRRDAALSVGAELLLRYALIRDFGITNLPEIEQNERRKPYFANMQGLYFNLSHSGEYAACLVSDEQDVGVDIQQMRNADMRTAKRVFDEEALLRLEADETRDELFCEFWTLHESAVKLNGGTVLDTVDSCVSKLIKAPTGYKIAIAIGK